jgi:hypothetical protein
MFFFPQQDFCGIWFGLGTRKICISINQVNTEALQQQIKVAVGRGLTYDKQLRQHVIFF